MANKWLGWPVCLVYWLVLCKALDYLPQGSDFVPAPAEEAALTKEIPWKYTACLPAWMCTLKIYLERETSTFISQELFANSPHLEFEGHILLSSVLVCTDHLNDFWSVWNFLNFDTVECDWGGFDWLLFLYKCKMTTGKWLLAHGQKYKQYNAVQRRSDKVKCNSNLKCWPHSAKVVSADEALRVRW